jgi:hypothetical protein
MANMVVPCPACGLEVRQGQLNDHMFTICKVARKQMAPPSPGGGKSHRVGSPGRQRSGAGTERSSSSSSLRARSPASSRTPRSARSEGRKPVQPLAVQPADADGRVPCGRCGRKFAPDRIAQHQYICAQLKRGPAKPPAEVSERARQLASGGAPTQTRTPLGGRGGRGGGGGGTGARAASAGRGGARAAPRHLGPGWREQSHLLREAMQAAREGRAVRSGRASGDRGGGFVLDTEFDGSNFGGGGGGGGGGYGGGYGSGGRGGPPRSPTRLVAGANTFSSRSASKPARPTMAQRSHAAESQRLQEALMSSPQRGGRPPMRTQCNGMAIQGGGGYPGMSATNVRGGVLPGSGGMPGGFDPASNQTSRDNPLYRGY